MHDQSGATSETWWADQSYTTCWDTILDGLDTLVKPIFELIENGALQAVDAAYQIGEIAANFACAILETKGHTAVWKAGGAGKPDILSLDQGGNLWVTESKGTMANRGLGASGLERTLSAPGSPETERESVKLMENSPAWLARNLPSTLGALNGAINLETNSRTRENLIALRYAYLEAARDNFCGTKLRSQVIQVGMALDMDLKPPYSSRSEMFDRWIEASNPDRIIQVDLYDSRRAGRTHINENK